MGKVLQGRVGTQQRGVLTYPGNLSARPSFGRLPNENDPFCVRAILYLEETYAHFS